MPTPSPDFTTVTDLIDLFSPLTSFAMYAAGILAAVLVIAFAFAAVRKLYYSVQHFILYRTDDDYADSYDRDKASAERMGIKF